MLADVAQRVACYDDIYETARLRRNLCHFVSCGATERGCGSGVAPTLLFQLWQRRSAWDLLISEAVLAEAEFGDADAAEQRIYFCNALSVLDLPAHTEALANHLLKAKAIPAKAYTDAVHIAIAALHGVQFIASWNFRHSAGALARRNIETALVSYGVIAPVIATPEEILENVK